MKVRGYEGRRTAGRALRVPCARSRFRVLDAPLADRQAAPPAVRPPDSGSPAQSRPIKTALLIGTVAASLLTTLALGSALANPNGTARVQVFLARSDPGIRCDKVYPVSRRVRTPAVLKGAVEALLRGPTAAERRRRYGGWFSARTAGMLRSVRLSQGVAYIDFRDFRRVIPNASSSCGSSLLLAQLDRTADQFPTVRRAIYSFNGSRRAFYEWLQLSPP